jgi:hypothetical protein
LKRERERAKLERRKEKDARRAEAKARRATEPRSGGGGGDDPDIAGIVPGPQPPRDDEV